MTEPHRWLDFAREDLLLAEMALGQEIHNQVCFHAQQGVEKALKGLLRNAQQLAPKTHSLAELLDRCGKVDVEALEFEDACATLDRYYIPTRYPDALPGTAPEGLPERRDAEQALRVLKDVLTWVEAKLQTAHVDRRRSRAKRDHH